MTVEELIKKLQAYPLDMPVKVSSVCGEEDVLCLTQDGEDYVKIVIGNARTQW